MKSFALNGTLRKELGKKATKAVRANGNIPCILYGNGKTIATFEVTSNDVRKLVYTPEIFVVELTIDGKSYKAVMQELQFHPVSDRIIHIDFLEVTEEKPVVMQVPVRLEGLAAGVKAGGKLSLDARKLKVQGLIKDIPEKLVVNVDALELGKAIQVKNLEFAGLKFISPANALVCSVKATRGSRAATSEE